MRPSPSSPQRRLARSGHGLSLIEVLVTLTIIATLAGLLLPALASARHAARAVACSANLRGWLQAVQAYALDYREALPLAIYPADLRLETLAPYDALALYTQSALPTLVGGHAVTAAPFLCPSDRQIGENADATGFSYTYRPWELFASFPGTTDSRRAGAIQRAVSRLVDRHPDEPIFQDNEPFHPQGGRTLFGFAGRSATGTGRQAIWNIARRNGSVTPQAVTPPE